MEERNESQQNSEGLQKVPTQYTAVKGKGMTAILSMLFFLFLFLFSFEFLQKNFIWLYFAFAVAIGTTRYFRFRKETIILAVLTQSIILCSGSLPSPMDMLRAASFPLCYFVGTNLYVEKDAKKLSLEKQDSLIRRVGYAFTIGSFLHFFINFLINLGSEDRNTVDFWSGAVRSATNQSLLGILMLAVAIALFFSNRGMMKKIVVGILLAIVVIYALALAGRTLLLMLFIVGGVAFLYMLFFNPNRSKTFWITCLVFFLALLAVGLYVFNAFGLQDWVTGSNFYKRFFGEKVEVGIGETGRWEAKAYYLEHFFDNIFGGSTMYKETGNFAHDILLDTYDQSGLFAFIALVLFFLCSLYQTLRFVFDRRFSFNIRQLVLCVNLVLGIQFFLEPIMQGAPWLFCVFCLMQGVIATARENANKIDEARWAQMVEEYE